MNKTISLILVILWATVIFILSSMPGSESNGTSKKVLVDVLEKTNIISEEELTDYNIYEVKDSLFNKIHYFFRKSLHFGEYLVLGIFVLNYLRFTKYNKNKLIIGLSLCFLYSVTDEVHQMFTYNRTPLFTDCLIDTFGALTGCLLFCLVDKKLKKHVRVDFYNKI